MLKIFTNNWQAKLICLLIAIAFWTYVASSQAKVDNFPGGIPLKLNNTPEGMIAITDVESVELKIVAERSIWTKLSSDNIIASVNLTNLTQGTHELPINIETKISGVEIVDYNPKTALIRLEPQVVKSVPVNVKIEGSVAEGLMPGIAETDPEEVEISGAKSIIDQILEATAVIRLDGETEDVTKNVKIVALSAESEKIKGITFKPEEVRVIVPIIKAGSTKTIGIKIKTSGQIATGYWISNITTEPSDVSITGSSSILRSINYLETKELNIDGINSTITRTVDLNIPSGITVTNQINSVKISIEVSSTSTSKQVIAQINPSNLAGNLKINSLDPNSISVNLAGSSANLDGANPDSVKLNLNLAQFNKEGLYKIDLSNSMFSVPEGITVTSFVPSSITVNLVNK